MTYIVSPSRIEPARLEDGIPLDLVETANRLIQSARGLGRNLPARTLSDLAAMVRMMNSYYSNRIEGNNTRPRDIERALAGDEEGGCLLYTSPSPRDRTRSRMPSSA